MTCVVTGASGFIGAALCRAIRAMDGVVTGVGRGLRPPAGFSGAWICAELAAEAPVLPNGATVLFHLAGRAHSVSELSGDSSEYVRANVEGTRHALDAAARAGVESFVYFSSVKVFGDSQQLPDRPLSEADLPQPDSPYGQSKLDAEKLVLADDRISHRVVIRPALVYGPGVKGNLARMREAVARRRFPSVRESGNRRSLVHVEDLVALAIAASCDSRASGRVYHASDGETYSTRRLYLAMCAACGRAPAGWTVPDFALSSLAFAGDAMGAVLRRRAPFDTPALRRLSESAWFSADRAREELGWMPLNTVESWCRSEGAE